MTNQEILDNAPSECNHYTPDAEWQYDKRAFEVRALSDIKRIAEIENQWISVKDRLPPKDCDDVYIWPRPDYGCECHAGFYESWNESWFAWSCDSGGFEKNKITVTHWMPLPEPPAG